jgi:protein O-mannosyl-transferase
MYLLRGSSRRPSQLMADLVPYLATVIGYLVLRWNALGFLVTSQVHINAGIVDWLTLIPRVVGQYVQYAVFPYPLAAYHLIAVRFADRVLPTLAYSSLIVAVGLLAWLARKKIANSPAWAVLFGVMLIPVLDFPAISTNFFAERYLYIPSLAAIVPISMGIGRLSNRWRQVLQIFALLSFGILTFARNRDWANNEKFYSSTLQIYPEATLFRVGLGEERMKAGDDLGAKNHFAKAIEDAKSNKYVQHGFQDYRALIGIAGIAAREERYSDAKAYLNEAAKLHTDDVGLYVYLGGIALQGDRDYPTALQYLQKAVQMDPLNETANDYLGVALFNLERYNEAARYFSEAVRINPNYKDGQLHLEMARQKLAGVATQR